jgi:5'(3')-deoxyribonucleotidase
MKKLYLDMDGVVADFNAYARDRIGRQEQGEKWPDKDWRKLTSNPHLYFDLEKTPEADELVKACTEFCEKNNYELLFLTAIPNNNDMPWAFYDKIRWVGLRYPSIPVMFGPYSNDKQHHCKPGDVLIDDRTSNIEQWRNVGGIGILHKGNLTNTLKELSDCA